MMDQVIGKIKERIVEPNLINSIVIDSNNSVVLYHLVILEKVNGNLTTLKKEGNIESIENLFQLLVPNAPTAVFITGDIIFDKTISDFPKDKTSILRLIYPNGNHEHLCFQLHENRREQQVSIVKIDSLNKLIAPFIEHKNVIIHTCFSRATRLEDIISLVGQENISMPDEENRVKIGDDWVEEYYIGAYYVGLQVFLNNYNEIFNFNSVEKQRELFFYDKGIYFLLRKCIPVIALLCIVLYCTNVFLMNQNNSFRDSIEYQQNANRQLDSLTNLINKKNQVLSQKNQFRQSITSFYIDRITSSMIDGITLQKLEVFPLTKKKSSNKKDENFKDDTIEIQGTCTSSAHLVEWISILNSEEWLEEILYKEYQEEKNGTGEFNLHIRIDPNS